MLLVVLPVIVLVCRVQCPITFVDRIFGTSKFGPAEIVQYLKGVFWLFLQI